MSTPKRLRFPRHKDNPYRPGGSYAVCFDILAAHGAEGLHRRKLLDLLERTTGKKRHRCAWDLAIVISAKDYGPRHRSCQEGYWVRRNNDHLTLVVDRIVE